MGTRLASRTAHQSKVIIMGILKRLLIATAGLFIVSNALAVTPVEEMLQKFRQQGPSSFSAASGKAFWNQKHYPSGSNQPRSCSTCHTNNVRQFGKHAKTGKEIKPLAPSVMSKRLTNPKKMRKWFRRNCSWVLGRECTAQEKGNVLMYLSNQ